MLPNLRIATATALLVMITGAGVTFADEQNSGATTEDDKVVETIEVKRAKLSKTKHQTLQFLKDHRVFIRSRLDLLRTQTTRVRSDDAEILDERYLQLQAMAAIIAAARDTVGSAHDSTTQRQLLDSVTELAELQGELDLMEELLADQRRRLLWLEQDFLGQQETALVILIRGLNGKHAPEAVVLIEDNETIRVGLKPEQRASLEQGGIAQIYHEFVEPREHVFAVSFTGGTWSAADAVRVPVEAQRDRLNFLELDLGQIDPDQSSGGLVASVWQR